MPLHATKTPDRHRGDVAELRVEMLEGKRCESCYGEGLIPTDQGPVACPDCGGSGTMPRQDTHIEWRVREIERALGVGLDESAQAIRWLVFELRRAREALTEVLTLSEAFPESAELERLHFVVNRALALYDEIPAPPSEAPK